MIRFWRNGTRSQPQITFGHDGVFGGLTEGFREKEEVADVLVAAEDGGGRIPGEIGWEGGCGDDEGASGQQAGFFDEEADQGVEFGPVLICGEAF